MKEKKMEAKEKEKKIAEIISIYLPGAEHLEESIKEAAHKIQALYADYKSPEEVNELLLRVQTDYMKLKNNDVLDAIIVTKKELSNFLIDPSAPIICPECGGSGRTSKSPEGYFGDRLIWTCPKCDGHGKLMKKCKKSCPIGYVDVEICDNCQDGLIPVTQQDLIDGAWNRRSDEKETVG